MNVLAIYGATHDSSVALIADGKVFAIELERISRLKHFCDHRLLTHQYLQNVVRYIPPNLQEVTAQAVHYVLEAAGITLDDLDLCAPWWPGVPRVEEPLGHHASHAASAFYPSGFDEAAVLVVDNFGDWHSDEKVLRETVSFWHGKGRDLQHIHTWFSPAWQFAEVTDRFAHHGSLGIFYTDCTLASGFKVMDGGKTMGLSPYGSDALLEPLRQHVHVSEHGQLLFNRQYQDVIRHAEPADVAFAAQKILEERMIDYVRQVVAHTGCRRLCLAGGIALNSVANGLIRDEVDELFVQPAAKDSGLSLGRAVQIFYSDPKNASFDLNYRGYYLGREYDLSRPIEAPDLEVRELPDDLLFDQVAERLAEGEIVAWYQGASEFGPRALGNRSILCDPREASAKDHLNARVKHRESFRPFAPSVLEEHFTEFFGGTGPTPYMLRVVPVVDPRIPAVTHVDGTARVQTVRRDQNPRFYQLIQAFGRRTGVPVLLNTSFNVRGQPIVETPHEALDTFRSTDIDVLVIGNTLYTSPAGAAKPAD